MIVTRIFRFKGELLGGEVRSNERFVRLERFVKFFSGEVALEEHEVEEIRTFLEQDFDEEMIAVPIRKTMIRHVHKDDIDALYQELTEILHMMKGEGQYGEVFRSNRTGSVA